MPSKNLLTPDIQEALIQTFKQRFKKNINRHEGIDWEKVESKLKLSPEKLWTLNEMERTGGEPDLVGFDDNTCEYIFYDCAAESPSGRRSFCYDHDALESRKEHKPKNSAINMAQSMGVELLSEADYRYLQTLGNFDTKTSSWLKTPSNIRKLGGAIFADFRFETVFVYHNGAQSYYAGRGFRGMLRV